jgi:hypothetical protein
MAAWCGPAAPARARRSARVSANAAGCTQHVRSRLEEQWMGGHAASGPASFLASLYRFRMGNAGAYIRLNPATQDCGCCELGDRQLSPCWWLARSMMSMERRAILVRWRARTSTNLGPVHLAYNPSYSACFFSRNSIFLSQKIIQQCFSTGL